MIKKFRSVEVNTDTMEISQNGNVIKCPYDIYKAFQYMSTFEYLKDNYTNDDETLWQIATETIEAQKESECNGHPITEGEAIEIACRSLNITLIEE